MTIDERRRLALHRAAAGSWGEEVADTLAELVRPSGGEPITLADLDERFAAQDARWEARLDERFAARDARWEARLDERFAAQDARIDALEARWDERFAAQDARWDQRMESMEHRLTGTFERRLTDAVTLQTRTLVVSQLGAVVVIAGLAFGLQ